MAWMVAALGLLACTAGAEPVAEVVGPATVEFGRYPAQEQPKAEFHVRNAGDASLDLTHVRNTCGGCAEVTCEPRALAPGAEAVLTVTILADSIFGPYRKSVFVETADPQHRVLQFTVTGDALPLVDVQPKRELNAGRLALGQEWRQTFTLTCTNPADTLGTPKLETNYPAEATAVLRGSAPLAGPSGRLGQADPALPVRPAKPAPTGPSPGRGPTAAGVGPAAGGPEGQWSSGGGAEAAPPPRVPQGPAYELLVRVTPVEANGDWRCVVVVPVARGGKEVGAARVAVTAQVGAMLVAVPAVVALPGVAERAARVRFGLRVMGGGAGQVRAEDVIVVAEWQPVRRGPGVGAEPAVPAAPGPPLPCRAEAVQGGLGVEVELGPEVLRRALGGEGLVLVCAVPGASPARVPCQPPR